MSLFFLSLWHPSREVPHGAVVEHALLMIALPLEPFQDPVRLVVQSHRDLRRVRALLLVHHQIETAETAEERAAKVH